MQGSGDAAPSRTQISVKSSDCRAESVRAAQGQAMIRCWSAPLSEQGCSGITWQTPNNCVLAALPNCTIGAARPCVSARSWVFRRLFTAQNAGGTVGALGGTGKSKTRDWNHGNRTPHRWRHCLLLQPVRALRAHLRSDLTPCLSIFYSPLRAQSGSPFTSFMSSRDRSASETCLLDITCCWPYFSAW